MDGSRFDALARATASGASRRALLGAALGGLIGLARGTAADAAVRRAFGQVCRKDGDCASGICLPKDATGRQRCGCLNVGECPAPDGVCTGCVDGVCIAAETCAENEACLDGRCLLALPYCADGGPECNKGIGVVANSGGVNACLSGDITFQPCETTGNCQPGEACILFLGPNGFEGLCVPGCRAVA